MPSWQTAMNFLVQASMNVRLLIFFMIMGAAFVLFRGFFLARKIQPRGFRWRTFRNEVFFGLINVTISGAILGSIQKALHGYGYGNSYATPATWWMIALEYAAYFFLFDTWFYWFHRLMHKEPIYRWVHKLHHWSTSPNVVTTASVNPLESLINGGFVPLFIFLFPLHRETLALIAPTNVIMGLYVHSGFEFFPRWWNKSWLTKWFITATFHDQHHKYFTANFGGYTTIWDRICGTMRPKFEADFEKLKDRSRAAPMGVEAAGEMASLAMIAARGR